jgi:ribonuclease T2
MNPTTRALTGLLAITLGLASPAAWPSERATGTFIASRICEAYVSKNKRTNPDSMTLTIGRSYPVFEVNKAVDPGWYRIRIETAQPPERWVDRNCGTADVLIGGTPPHEEDRPDRCRTAGLADSYVLALSWQPAFCETVHSRGDKPECHLTDPKAYQAKNFTLHGLWPNQQACGTRYGYCGEVGGSPGGFCDYPVLDLFTETREELGEVMPSAAAGSCLQRHEWHKHGTCQTAWSQDAYYEVAIDLTRQFNRAGAAYFMSRNVGEEVSTEAFLERVDCALGEGARERLELKCKGGNLVDIYVNLPADIAPGEDLRALIARAAPDFRNGCGDSFRVDPIGLAP